jgi:hypothetical protein
MTQVVSGEIWSLLNVMHACMPLMRQRKEKTGPSKTFIGTAGLPRNLKLALL